LVPPGDPFLNSLDPNFTLNPRIDTQVCLT
jgi:hypothetical protein